MKRGAFPFIWKAENKPAEPDLDNTSEGIKMTRLNFYFLTIFFTSSILAQDIGISGRVINQATGAGVPQASITSGEQGTSTDENGNFFLAIPLGREITVSRIGYRVSRMRVLSEVLIVELEPIVLRGTEVHVLANRAVPGVTPGSFSTLTEEEIKTHYNFQDVPMVLSTEPGVYAYSESGNGTGYSYVSIRGFDQSRISVMIDNVPLNDNESHQVYWVDHGDILSDAQDVQIQRGVGNSLYGAAAFGGSINIISKVRTEEEETKLTYGGGSYNTRKVSGQYKSGERLGENWSVSGRLSQISSDGYRDNHNSLQQALSLGAEYSGRKMNHKLNTLFGYENTDLMWDGVYGDDINNRTKRKEGNKAFTDDFLQQIYSLNSRFELADGSVFHNTAYLVLGSGYYEAEKSGRKFYDYNLDTITDTSYADSTTDLLRRKWIVNRYFGLVPQWTKKTDQYRLDFGGEIRYYTGDHFGKVSGFSSPFLSILDEFKYYQYVGKKVSLTAFGRMALRITSQLIATAGFQIVTHSWDMNQSKIGHAAGHKLNAKWTFLNPRVGLVYKISDDISLFASYGKAGKEPADDQIINADEWKFSPKGAYPEVISDLEAGFSYSGNEFYTGLNLYRISLENEVVKKISFEEEGTYEYSQVPGAIHQGLEFEVSWNMTNSMWINGNVSLLQHAYSTGDNSGNLLPNSPDLLGNLSFHFKPTSETEMYVSSQSVGKRYLDAANTDSLAMGAYSVVNLGVILNRGPLELRAKVMNAMDTLYETHGEDWGWGYIAYWPAATRNAYFSVAYSF